MWPFEDTLRGQDPIRKFREWLKKWLFGGNRLYTVATIVLVAAVSLLSAYGFYAWQKAPNTGEVVTINKGTLPTNCPQGQPPCRQNNNNQAAQNQTRPSLAPVEVKPEEMVKPVMGPVLTSVGMTFSQVFKDYRYNTGVALGAKPGAEVKVIMPGTVTLVASGEQGTRQVNIDHGNGWQSTYSGLDRVQVKAGQKLAAGAVLGTLGQYQRTDGVLENHLYLKVTRYGKPIDPNIYWK